MRNYKKTALFVTVSGLSQSFMLGYFGKEIKTANVFFEPKETDISLMMRLIKSLKEDSLCPEDWMKRIWFRSVINGMVQLS